ncbi:uncharacterized protein EDB91DRAFT_1055671 [Suillus paluster]|uniref:uncharacterized protein n=1 Tax=Suillus paluster TaxID=48578 RepID=UPI001B8748A4|nr:uncharacterized protein EDB91DRAFT_1055671 [Suillus paluster]KAG1736390.1 hypothetical protein EDB91DRAFT_1055671 [Suillus paluster]
MPKAAKLRYCRHFKPLTIHCEFPPECNYTPPPLTQHQLFSRNTDSSTSDAAQPITPVAQLPIPLPAKILKPRGDISRISRGGYNLQEALGWPASEYEETRAFVSQLACEYLKVNKSWRLQAQPRLAIVYAEVQKRYPILECYDGSWVVGNMLRIYLKNSCSCDT